MNQLSLRKILYTALAVGGAGVVTAGVLSQSPRPAMTQFRQGTQFVPIRTMEEDTMGMRPMELLPAPKVTMTPMASPKQAESVPTIYGSLISSKVGSDGTAANAKGMWSFNASGPIKRLNTNCNATFSGAPMDNGNYYAVTRSGASYYIDRFTISTWKRATHTKLSNNQLAASDVAYDPTTDMIYGCFYNNTGDGYVFGRADYATRKRYIIKPLSIGYNAVMADPSGQIYAIDMTGMLMKVNKATGETTNIGHTSVTPQYTSSATIDPNTGRCYWCVNPASEKGYLYEVDLTTGQATLLHEFVHSDEFMGIFVPENAPAADAPGIPTSLTATFTSGALTGTVAFTLPETTNNGSALSGNVDYILWVDGLPYAAASGATGTQVSVPVTLSEAGMHSMVVRCSNASGVGKRAKAKVFAGNDTPKAPAPTLSREGDVFSVSWKKVTTSVNNGYIDPSRLTYKVTRLPDNVVVATATPDTVVKDTVKATPGRVIAYQYRVSATFEGNEGATGTTSVYPVGEIAAPWSEGFDNAESLNNFIILDSNSDGVTWKYSPSMSSAYITDAKVKHDDWLISAAIRMEKGVKYKLAFEAMASFNPERIEVRMGRAATPSALTTELVPPTDLEADFSLKPTVPEFTVSESGLYYIGWHAISDANAFYLYVDNITLTDDVNHEVDAITPPYLQEFSESASLKDFTIVDGNNDGYMWNVDKGEARVMSGNDLNDWLISPPMALKAENRYDVSLLAHSYMEEQQPSYLELRVGTTLSVDSMKSILIPATAINNPTVPVKLSQFFAPETDGKYYIAIHAYGPTNGIYVDNFRVAAPVTAASPAAPTECSITPAPYGELKGTVKFKVPALTVGGEKLQNLEKVEVMLGDSVAHTFTAPQPGAALECEVRVPESGTHNFAITAFNAAGAGIPAELSEYIGINIPSNPTNVEMTEEGNTGKVTITWNAPKTDINGYLIRPQGLMYIVGEVVNGQAVLLARDIADTTFTVQAVAPGEDQKYKTYVVFASNAAGMSQGMTSNARPVGKPYAVPYKESYPNGRAQHLAVTNVIQPQGSWATYNNGTLDVSAQDNDNGFCGFTGANPGAAGAMFTGKIDLVGLDKPELSFFAYNPFNNNTNLIAIQLLDPDGNVHNLFQKSLAEIGTAGWNKVTVPLKQFKGKTVQLAIATYTNSYTNSLFDNFTIDNSLGVDGLLLDTPTVTGRQGAIDIVGAAGNIVTVSDMQGCIRYSAKANETLTIPVSAGVYLVKIGTHNYKVMVK